MGLQLWGALLLNSLYRIQSEGLRENKQEPDLGILDVLHLDPGDVFVIFVASVIYMAYMTCNDPIRLP